MEEEGNTGSKTRFGGLPSGTVLALQQFSRWSVDLKSTALTQNCLLFFYSWFLEEKDLKYKLMQLSTMETCYI